VSCQRLALLRHVADDRPQVLYSQSGSSTYAANYLQGLLAIPQFREAIVASQYTERGDAKLYTSELSSAMTMDCS